MPSSLSVLPHGWPLLWLAVTLLAYRVACATDVRTHHHPLTTPVALGAVIMMFLVLVSRTPYEVYFDSVRPLHFCLGPATVAMAIPLYVYTQRLRDDLGPLLITLVVGSLTAIMSALVIGRSLGASPEMLLSLAPKSTTMPVAMIVSERMGGSPSLTSLTVTMTGISGAVMAPAVWRLLRIDDMAHRGFVVGLTSHAIGTGYAFQVGEVAGAFAALGMGLNAMATAILLPPLLHLFALR